MVLVTAKSHIIS